MVSLEKWLTLTPLQKLLKNGGDWGKIIVPKGFKKLPKSNKSPNLVTLLIKCFKRLTTGLLPDLNDSSLIIFEFTRSQYKGLTMNHRPSFTLSEIQIIMPERAKPEVPMFEQTMSLLEMIKEQKVRLAMFLMGQTRPLFCLFLFFSQDK